MTTTVTAKGAVVLPREVLKQHRVRAGDFAHTGLRVVNLFLYRFKQRFYRAAVP